MDFDFHIPMIGWLPYEIQCSSEVSDSVDIMSQPASKGHTYTQRRLTVDASFHFTQCDCLVPRGQIKPERETDQRLLYAQARLLEMPCFASDLGTTVFDDSIQNRRVFGDQ